VDQQHIGRGETQGKREHKNFFRATHNQHDRELPNSGKRAECFELKSKVSEAKRLKSGYFTAIAGADP